MKALVALFILSNISITFAATEQLTLPKKFLNTKLFLNTYFSSKKGKKPYKPLNTKIVKFKTTTSTQIDLIDLQSNKVIQSFPIMKTSPQMLLSLENSYRKIDYRVGIYRSDEGMTDEHKEKTISSQERSILKVETIPSRSDFFSLHIAPKPGSGISLIQTFVIHEENTNFKPQLAFEGRAKTKVAFYNSFPFLNNDNATYISKHDFSKPRTYYLTKNIPKNLRESFVDGINYWNNIFGKQNIVIKDAYQGIRPWHPGVNLVEFIDDKTNGASSGSMTLNPETGEIMGSYVYVTSGFLQYALEMGSQVGTDHNLDSEKLNEFKVRFQEDYIRQTVAHEIGHSLGIRHNFAGSEGRDFDLSKFPKILKDYVLSDKIHPELISTTTLMDYLHIKFFALIGAKIRQQTKPLPYDKAMIEFGYNSGSIPSDTPFCLRKSLDTVLDFNGEKITCKKWDPEI